MNSGKWTPGNNTGFVREIHVQSPSLIVLGLLTLGKLFNLFFFEPLLP